MLNHKKNETVAKIKEKKLKFYARCHSIKFKIIKTKIMRFDLNSYDCHTLKKLKS